MSTAIPGRLARRVVARAADRCEYCGLAQAGQAAKFHLDHVVPQSADGATTFANLALACVSCSLCKGARQFVPDPLTGQSVPLFNPRQQVWTDHFRWRGAEVVGLTATGRATIVALEMNRPVIVAIREEETLRGRHPPPA